MYSLLKLAKLAFSAVQALRSVLKPKQGYEGIFHSRSRSTLMTRQGVFASSSGIKGSSGAVISSVSTWCCLVKTSNREKWLEACFFRAVTTEMAMHLQRKSKTRNPCAASVQTESRDISLFLPKSVMQTLASARRLCTKWCSALLPAVLFQDLTDERPALWSCLH